MVAGKHQSLIVGVADCLVSNDPQTSLITYALGSCIAVAIHDAQARVGGLLHFMLPESCGAREKAEQNPYMFADSGIPLLFQRAYRAGADKRRLVVSIAGGAQVADVQGLFNIGKRNYAAVQNLFRHAGVRIHAEAVGGTDSRTMRLNIGTGEVLLRTRGASKELPARC